MSLRVQLPSLALIMELTVGVPEVVTSNEPDAPEATESVAALEKVGAEPIVRVKAWVGLGTTPFEAVRQKV